MTIAVYRTEGGHVLIGLPGCEHALTLTGSEAAELYLAIGASKPLAADVAPEPEAVWSLRRIYDTLDRLAVLGDEDASRDRQTAKRMLAWHADYEEQEAVTARPQPGDDPATSAMIVALVAIIRSNERAVSLDEAITAARRAVGMAGPGLYEDAADYDAVIRLALGR